MGVLTDDTTRLRTQIDELRQSRKAALSDLTRQVRELQDNVTETMAGFRDTRLGTAAQQRADLAAFTSDLTDSVAAILDDARDTVAGFRNTREGAAREQKADLATFAATLGDTVGALLGDFHGARLEMAQETRDERLASIGAIRDGVNALRRDVAGDLAGARQAWSGTRPAVRVKVTAPKRATVRPPTVAKPAPPPAVEPAPEKHAAPAPRAEAEPEPRVETPDDLATIKGIGPVMQQRLNAAGIVTYGQLAHASPDELKDKLGECGHLANVAKWVTDAGELAK